MMGTKRHSKALGRREAKYYCSGRGFTTQRKKVKENEYYVLSSTNYLMSMHDCLSISNNLILNRMHSKYLRVCVYVGVCIYAFAVVIVYVCDKLKLITLNILLISLIWCILLVSSQQTSGVQFCFAPVNRVWCCDHKYLQSDKYIYLLAISRFFVSFSSLAFSSFSSSSFVCSEFLSAISQKFKQESIEIYFLIGEKILFFYIYVSFYLLLLFLYSTQKKVIVFR